MTNNAEKWVSEAYQDGCLQAAFIDYTHEELNRVGNVYPFVHGKNLATTLRTAGISPSHFYFDHDESRRNAPLLYKDADETIFPFKEMNFSIVIPDPHEWIFPKRQFDGFSNPFANQIIYGHDKVGGSNQPSTVIFAGVRALCCLRDTVMGSFTRVTKWENHRAVVVTNATDSGSDLSAFQTEFLSTANPSFKDNIAFCTTEKIADCLPVMASQFSPPHPYTALGLQG